MSTWKQFRQSYLDELLHHNGLAGGSLTCAICNDPLKHAEFAVPTMNVLALAWFARNAVLRITCACRFTGFRYVLNPPRELPL